MRYFVLHPNGQRYGPADVMTLSRWSAEGRLHPSTTVEEEESGQRLPVAAVPGFVAPHSAVYGVLAPPVIGQAVEAEDVEERAGVVDLSISWVLIFLSFVLLPIVPAVAAYIFAGRAITAGSSFGRSARVFSVIAFAAQCIGVVILVRSKMLHPM